MSQIILTVNDELASQMFAYTTKHQISFDEMTEKLWVDFLQKNAKENSNEDTFFQLLENTKGIWKNGDGLEFQEKLRAEWE